MSNLISDSVGSVAGWWTNTFGAGAGQQELGQQLDAKLQAVNTGADGYQPGGAIYNKIVAANGGDTAAAVLAMQQDQAQMDAQAADTATYQDQVTAAGQAGAAQGLDNAKSAVNHFFESLFGLIPASLWLIAAGALFLYFGGWGWLTRQFRKKLSA